MSKNAAGDWEFDSADESEQKETAATTNQGSTVRPSSSLFMDLTFTVSSRYDWCLLKQKGFSPAALFLIFKLSCNFFSLARCQTYLKSCQ